MGRPKKKEDAVLKSVYIEGNLIRALEEKIGNSMSFTEAVETGIMLLLDEGDVVKKLSVLKEEIKKRDEKIKELEREVERLKRRIAMMERRKEKKFSWSEITAEEFLDLAKDKIQTGMSWRELMTSLGIDKKNLRLMNDLFTRFCEISGGNIYRLVDSDWLLRPPSGKKQYSPIDFVFFRKK